MKQTAVQQLEQKLAKQWQSVDQSRTQIEFQAKRSEALKTYQLLKRQQLMAGVQ